MARSSRTGALLITVGSTVACATIVALAVHFPLHVIYLTAFGVIYGSTVIAIAACVAGGALAIGGVHRLARRTAAPPALPRAVALPRRPRAMFAA